MEPAQDLSPLPMGQKWGQQDHAILFLISQTLLSPAPKRQKLQESKIVAIPLLMERLPYARRCHAQPIL